MPTCRTKWNRRKEKIERPPTPPVTPEWEKLVTENTALAHWCVEKYAPSKGAEDKEQWAAEALFALTRAARGYDPTYRQKNGQPVTFGTYAVRSILRQFQYVQEVAQRNASHLKEQPLSGEYGGDDWTSEGLATEDTGADQFDAKADVRLLIRKAHLTAIQSKVVWLRHRKDMTFRQIGAEIGRSGETAKTHYYIALERMRFVAAGFKLGEQRWCRPDRDYGAAE